MRLLTGPAGSGKTTFILEQFREALRQRNEAIRLLVPTATLAQHLQNRLAREGFVFQRSLIQTLSGFIEAWAQDVPQVPDTVFHLIVEEAVRRVNRPEFARVANLWGFCSSVARTIGEFSSAGCDSARLAANVPDGPLAPAFLSIYQDVECELGRRGLALRAKRLANAASRIEVEGAGGIRAIWLDGFHALPDPELAVIHALSRHADITLTLNDTDLAEAARRRLVEMGFREERMPRSRPAPALALVRSPGIEREAEEIARRIVEQAAAGRPFREMGIIVRPSETYVPILRSTLERFGIPARFYFDSDLEQHAVIRFLSGLIDAMLGGWNHEQTLAVLRLAPRFADSTALDRFDFAVREQIPNAGLGALKSLLVKEDGQPFSQGAERLLHKIGSFAAIEEWESFSLTPRDWAARLKTLRNLFRPSVREACSHELVLQWRSQAAVLELFDEALEEAAAALDPERTIALEPFWRVVKSVLRLKPLRLDDGRRNVVHVLSAPEARQWVLPVVFVCGMVEKQFPQFHRQDAFFSDSARCRLNEVGIRVRTAAEFEREERALFEAAITRATLLVTLSYPEFDSRGDRNLPSLFLDDLLLPADASRAVRPQPRHMPAHSGRGGICAPQLLESLREKSAKLSPTGLEMYLQCPFQYFAGRTLRLKELPKRREQRLDFMTQGNIVHEVLAAWWNKPQDVVKLFEEVFAHYAEERRIPRAYQTERIRNAMLDDLLAFTRDDRWPRSQFQSRTEEKFEMTLDGSIVISGKIDRLDVAADGCAYVIDYKYSGAQRTRGRLDDDRLLQAPLYLMAAERYFHVKPEGMYYIGLKGGIVYAGWANEQVGEVPGEPLSPEWIERTEERTLRIVDEIRNGRVAVAPADPDSCRFCDYRDVCRVETRQAAVRAEGA
jgi:ATP-dependent helicase/DNAse subunit B